MTKILSEKVFTEQYQEYLNAREVNLEKIKEQKYKTPDFKLIGETFLGLNELKIPELIFDPLQNVYVFKTIHSKLLQFINKSLKQLASFDPDHKVPWIITFASNHFQLNWSKFQDTLRGGVEFDNKLLPDFTNTDAFKRVRHKFKEADLYIWFQVSPENDKFYQVSFFYNPSSPHKNLVDELIVKLSKTPVSTMDKYVSLT